MCGVMGSMSPAPPRRSNSRWPGPIRPAPPAPPRRWSTISTSNSSGPTARCNTRTVSPARATRPRSPPPTVKPGNLPGRPLWLWPSPDGAVTFRYKPNDTRLEVGAVETQAFSYTPGAPLSADTAVLYVQARDEAGLWSAMSRATIVISAEDAAAVQGGVAAFPPSVQAV